MSVVYDYSKNKSITFNLKHSNSLCISTKNEFELL